MTRIYKFFIDPKDYFFDLYLPEPHYSGQVRLLDAIIAGAKAQGVTVQEIIEHKETRTL